MTMEKVFRGKSVWDSETFSEDLFRFSLGSNSLAELRAHRRLFAAPLDASAAAAYDTSLFPSLVKDAQQIQTQVEDGMGFCRVVGLDTEEFSHSELRHIFLLIGGMMGRPLPQNAKGETLIEVRDRGGSMRTGARYHDTKDGGSLHTDSPQYPHPPDVLGLQCLHPAKAGGESRLVSAPAVHNRLQKERPHVLETLYQAFHFDKRGDFARGESPTTFAPVFTRSDRLRFRYLRDYIDSGHLRADEPLTPNQLEALGAVDELLGSPSLVVRTKLAAGDILFNDNNTVVHGRTAFEDWPEPERRRVMARLWLRTREPDRDSAEALG